MRGDDWACDSFGAAAGALAVGADVEAAGVA